MPRKRKRKSKEEDQMPHDEDLDPSKLQVLIDGKPRELTHYLRDFTRRHYPDVPHQTLVVPPIVFHKNVEISNEDCRRKLEESSAKSVCEGVTVMRVDEKSESTRRGSEAEYRVVEGFRHLGQSLGGPNAVIVGHKFENYLNKVKKQLRNVPLPGDEGTKERGEHDLLFIGPDWGILIVSVKSVGGNFSDLNLTVEQQQDTLQRTLLKKNTIQQLADEIKVAEHVLPDLSPPVTCALALPNISREFLASVLSGCESLRTKLDHVLKGDSSQLCLCSEEFPPMDRLSADDKWKASLMEWFTLRFPRPDGFQPALTPQQYEDVFARYCGLLSTVDIPHRSSKVHIEVRRLPEAVSEVNRHFRSLLLLPDQVTRLCSSIRRVYLHGLMGSGKTVMLMLKARQWLHRGCDVILINVSYDGHGSPIGYRLLNDIEEFAERDGKIALLNVRLSILDKAQLLEQIRCKREEMRMSPEASTSGSASSRGGMPPVHFLLDEVYDKFQPVFEVLLEGFPESEIWAAGLDGAHVPSTFQAFEMTKVLRNPPSVQRVVQQTDKKPARRQKYIVCGATEGLASEGPDPRFILHQNHASSSSTSSISSSSSSSSFSFMDSYSPLNCKACAEETIKIFSEIFGCSRKTSATCEEESTSEADEKLFMKNTACPVQLTDVVMLCKDPEGRRVYPKHEDGIYRLDEGLLKEFMAKVDQSLYVNSLREAGYPVRVVSDPHSEELALSNQNALTASWVNPASGLEWAVVLYMPGDPTAEASRSSERVQLSEEAVSELSLTSGSLAASESACLVGTPEPAENPDLLPKLSENPNFLSESSQHPYACPEPSKDPHASSESSETPSMPSALRKTADASSECSQSSGAEGNVGDALGQGLQTVQTRMSFRDREYLFWGASRCTAQLIVLVP